MSKPSKYPSGPVRFASFDGPFEKAAYEEVLNRAAALFERCGAGRSRQDIMMDLSATHATMPLDIVKLAAADDLNFAHDITGIYRHLDRESGQLRDHFVPRCALSKEAV